MMSNEELVSGILAQYVAKATNMALTHSLTRLRSQRGRLAAQLNQQLKGFSRDVGFVAALGHEAADPVTGVSFGSYIPLAPRYLLHKREAGVINGNENRFHHFSGNLARALYGIDVTEDTRWGRVLVKDIEISLNDDAKLEPITRRGRQTTVVRGSLGRFTQTLNLKYFQVKVPIFKKLNERWPTKPEYLMFKGDFKGDNYALPKLMGYHRFSKARGGSTNYRPLVPYYLEWYYTIKIPNLMRNFQWQS